MPSEASYKDQQNNNADLWDFWEINEIVIIVFCFSRLGIELRAFTLIHILSPFIVILWNDWETGYKKSWKAVHKGNSSRTGIDVENVYLPCKHPKDIYPGQGY